MTTKTVSITLSVTYDTTDEDRDTHQHDLRAYLIALSKQPGAFEPKPYMHATNVVLMEEYEVPMTIPKHELFP